MRRALILLPLLAAACAAPPKVVPVVAPPPPVNPTGLERVLGQDARGLLQLFGAANQDLREQGARKLQFMGPFCILDAYLYPPAEGREAVVTHVDARQPDGRDMDRASCVAALTRRVEAR